MGTLFYPCGFYCVKSLADGRFICKRFIMKGRDRMRHTDFAGIDFTRFLNEIQ